jgi:hypothetical protein
MEYSTMSIAQIASVIKKDWTKMNYGAVPYYEAMTCLNNVTDKYGADSGRSIVAYFLSNAATWKGETAKAIKKELNKRIK